MQLAELKVYQREAEVFINGLLYKNRRLQRRVREEEDRGREEGKKILVVVSEEGGGGGVVISSEEKKDDGREDQLLGYKRDTVHERGGVVDGGDGVFQRLRALLSYLVSCLTMGILWVLLLPLRAVRLILGFVWWCFMWPLVSGPVAVVRRGVMGVVWMGVFLGVIGFLGIGGIVVWVEKKMGSRRGKGGLGRKWRWLVTRSSVVLGEELNIFK